MSKETTRLSKKDRFILFYGILLGALLGALGNFVVSYYIEWQKIDFLEGSIWGVGYHVALYIFAGLCAVLTIAAFWYILSSEKKECQPQTEIEETEGEKQKTPLKLEKARLEEYRQLMGSLWSRARDYVTVQSILISGSLLAVTIALRSTDGIDKLTTSVVLIGAILLVILSGVYRQTTRKVNEIFWGRIHELERLLGIEVGNRGLYEKRMKCTGWYYWRKHIWNLVLGILFIIYLVALLGYLVY